MRALHMGGSNAETFDAKTSTINANAAIQALQQMRASNPSGGALGQVSNFEDQLLRSTIADIRPNQAPEDVAKGLIRMKAALQVLASKKYDDGDTAQFNEDFKRAYEDLLIQHTNTAKPKGFSGVTRIK
jgi:hypothetical protein